MPLPRSCSWPRSERGRCRRPRSRDWKAARRPRRSRRSRRGWTPLNPGTSSKSRPVSTRETWSSTSRCISRGAAVPGSRARARAASCASAPAAWCIEGSRHRRPGRRRSRARFLGHSRGRAAGHRPRLPDHALSLRHLSARGGRLAGSNVAGSKGFRERIRREGERHPRLEYERFHALGERHRGRARRLLHPVLLARRRSGQRRPRPAFSGALHVLRRQSLRGQPLRERRRRNGTDVLQAHRLPAKPLSSQSRFRLGRTPVQVLRRRPRRVESHRRQRPRDLPRGLYNNVFRGNAAAESDAAIVLYDSCAGNRFEGNSFVANQTPLTLVGRRTDTRLDGNYWSDNSEPDLDGDGRTDRPYRLSSRLRPFPWQPDGRRSLHAGFRGRRSRRGRADFSGSRSGPRGGPFAPGEAASASSGAAAGARPARPDVAGIAGSALGLAGGLTALLAGRR